MKDPAFDGSGHDVLAARLGVERDLTPRHPIRVVAQRTGLTPATLRAWERRYSAIHPSRSPAGQRLYSDRDVERLLALRRLTEAGRPISMVASLSEEEALALLLEDQRATRDAEISNGVEPAGVLERASGQIRTLDGSGLEQTLWRAAVMLDGRSFLDDVIAPLLDRLGEGWIAGEIDPGQEHVASDVIDRVLSRVADPSRSNSGPGLVVATLRGERHGLGARLVAAAASVEGWAVTYLGIDLPPVDIASAAHSVGAVAVAIRVVGRDRIGETITDLTELRDKLEPSVDLLIGGRAAELLDTDRLPRNATVLHGLDSFRTVRPDIG